LLYEYVITFEREATHFWGRKATGATALFFCNRYIPLVVNLVSLVGLAPLSGRVSTDITHSAFAALRVFALSERRWPVAMVVLLLSLIPVAINLYLYSTFTSLNDPIFGLTITSRTSLMAADSIVILVTISATHAARRPEQGFYRRPSFAKTLLRDGHVDYSIWSLRTLLILNALHLTFTMLPLSDDSLSAVSFVTLFTEPITAVLISRFLLNLQAVNRSTAELESTLHIGTLDFGRVVGSLGSSLSPSASKDDLDIMDGEYRCEQPENQAHITVHDIELR
ncbi:hypothetical protein BV20DRAFT_955979, partial [Pilatotrama ljubarskyi]